MSATPLQETIVLGVEHDANLRKTLIEILRELGAGSFEKTWGLAGSQEVQSMKTQLRGKDLLVEAETYAGLSITGESCLVRQISALVSNRLGGRFDRC